MPNFIQKLLTRADDGLRGDMAFAGYADEPDPVDAAFEPVEAPREVFAVERLHGVVSGTLDKLRNDEAQLVNEINYRMEKLRQVRVSIRAVESAYSVLDADLQNPAAEPPMPQIG